MAAVSAAARYLAVLHAAAEPVLTCPHAGVPLRRAAAAVTDADDLLVAAEALLPLILDLEAAAETLAAHARRLRTALAEVMADSGATTVRHGHLTASVSDGRAAVVITDAAALPPSLLRTPPPQPDKAAIARLLRAGHAVPGAALGNAQPVLTIRAVERTR